MKADNKTMSTIAKTLRKNMTVAERFLWNRLRARQLANFKFRRQEPIGRFIADFACYENRLIIELDGGQHAGQKEKDGVRDQWFRQQGFRVLRFWNNDILNNIEGVLEEITKNLTPPLVPPARGGGALPWGGKEEKRL